MRIKSLCVLLLVVACGSNDDSTSSASACNALVDDGPTVTLTAVPDDTVEPVGGALSDGRYHLSGLILHTGPNGGNIAPAQSMSVTLELKGSTMQQVGKADGAVKRYTVTVATSGTTLSTTDTCPVPDSSTHQFSATAEAFRIFNETELGIVEQVYSK